MQRKLQSCIWLEFSLRGILAKRKTIAILDLVGNPKIEIDVLRSNRQFRNQFRDLSCGLDVAYCGLDIGTQENEVCV